MHFIPAEDARAAIGLEDKDCAAMFRGIELGDENACTLPNLGGSADNAFTLLFIPVEDTGVVIGLDDEYCALALTGIQLGENDCA